MEVPDTITTWLTEAVGLSAESGLGLAKQIGLRAFKPFFIEFTLPYRVIRGEQTKIPLTVHNYLAMCLEVKVDALNQGRRLSTQQQHKGSWISFFSPRQVHVKISVPKGIKFVGHPGKHHMTRKKCVAPGEAKPTSIVLSFGELGQNNITGGAWLFDFDLWSWVGQEDPSCPDPAGF